MKFRIECSKDITKFQFERLHLLPLCQRLVLFVLLKKLGYEGYSELLYALKIDSTTNVDYKASDAIRSIIIEERSLDVIDNFIRDLASGEYERIHVIGIGYSDYIAQYLRDKLLELDYFSTNKSPLDFLNSRKSLILFVSESGETTDLIFIEERCKK